MIQSTQDILVISKAFAVLWLAVFAGWLIYYLAMTVREAYLITKGMRQRLSKIDALLDSLKDKVDHSTSYLLLIGEGIKKLVEMASDYGLSRGAKASRKKNK
jgi:hypothetical protein